MLWQVRIGLSSIVMAENLRTPCLKKVSNGILDPSALSMGCLHDSTNSATASIADRIPKSPLDVQVDPNRLSARSVRKLSPCSTPSCRLQSLRNVSIQATKAMKRIDNTVSISQPAFVVSVCFGMSRIARWLVYDEYTEPSCGPRMSSHSVDAP